MSSSKKAGMQKVSFSIETLDQAMVDLHQGMARVDVAKPSGVSWETLYAALKEMWPERYREIMDRRRGKGRKAGGDAKKGGYHNNENGIPMYRAKIVFTVEQLQEAMERLHDLEHRDAIATTYGCGFSTLEKALREFAPDMLKAIMTKRLHAGKTKGGEGSSKKKVRGAPAKKGGGFILHLPGSGIQPLPNGMGESPRWPVRGLAEFTEVELAKVTTRLLGRLRTA